MTLTNKTILLVGFIVLSSATVLYWFTQRLFEHMDHFKQSMAVEKQYLKAQFNKEVADLQEKREQLSQEVSDHLSGMERQLAKNQEQADEFDRNFLNGQNEVFDKMENAFGSGK